MGGRGHQRGSVRRSSQGGVGGAAGQEDGGAFPEGTEERAPDQAGARRLRHGDGRGRNTQSGHLIDSIPSLSIQVIPPFLFCARNYTVNQLNESLLLLVNVSARSCLGPTQQNIHDFLNRK